MAWQCKWGDYKPWALKDPNLSVKSKKKCTFKKIKVIGAK